jgi:lichenan operon transcriptional antiterminator
VGTDHREDLLQLLRGAGTPTSGAELSGRLGVSTRSVRQFVKDLNARAGEDLVRSSHRGYELNLNAYQRLRSRLARSGARDRARHDTPDERLYYLARQLVTRPDGTGVAELAERLSVSLDTLEGDLARARELFRAHDLQLRREREVLTVLGSERDKRRLVRQVLLDSTDGLNPAALREAARDYRDFDLRGLHEGLRTALAGAGAESNEYALNDLLIHLVIAADRVRGGHTIDAGTTGAPTIPAHDDFTARALPAVISAVEDSLGVVLPPDEQRTLSELLRARGRPRSTAEGAAPAVEQEVLALVRDILRQVSQQYLLDLGDDQTILSLALHVQSMLVRARSPRTPQHPLGTGFKRLHPLIHELAVFFASAVETRTRVRIDADEVDFLSLHLGAQFQRQLDQGPLITVTCVVPEYRDLHHDLAARLGVAIADQGVVEAVITSLDHDWAEVSSDVIVSVVDLGATTSAPVVQVSPLLGQDDIDRVREVIRSERARVTRQTLRSNLLSLVDPRLFRHLPAVVSRPDALGLLCDALVGAGYVGAGFLSDVLDRERRSSTAFGEQFAVPHSLYPDARRTGIAVLVTDRPVPWGDHGVRLVLLVAVSSSQRRLFRDALDQLIAVLGDPAAVQQIVDRADSHEGFVAALSDLLEG